MIALVVLKLLKGKDNYIYCENGEYNRDTNKSRFSINALLVDDNLTVLDSAQGFGIGYLISINKPDTHLPKRDITAYPAIDDFREAAPLTLPPWAFRVFVP